MIVLGIFAGFLVFGAAVGAIACISQLFLDFIFKKRFGFAIWFGYGFGVAFPCFATSAFLGIYVACKIGGY